MDPLNVFNQSCWQEQYSYEQQTKATQALENGQILFFPKLNFQLNANEKCFLSPVYADPKFKNISYNTHTEELRGTQATTQEKTEIKEMLQRFLQQAQNLINRVLTHYQPNIIIGRTSLRLMEVSYRKMSYRKDDKRLHVDAFPSSPNQGLRILRVFSNVNPNGIDRVWRVGESFEKVARHFMPKIPKPWPGSAKILKLLGITKSLRTSYDHYMLQIHDRMKEDENYQRQVKFSELRLTPGSSWIVQTDQVSHAAMSGQFMLEQTFYLPVEAMLNPELSPLRILEKIKGRKLAGIG